jgi:hypothetical protein
MWKLATVPGAGKSCPAKGKAGGWTSEWAGYKKKYNEERLWWALKIF